MVPDQDRATHALHQFALLDLAWVGDWHLDFCPKAQLFESALFEALGNKVD